ncbi:MAG: hypothetical protein WD042_09025 [Phycisphaeraceae bacterium]
MSAGEGLSDVLRDMAQGAAAREVKPSDEALREEPDGGADVADDADDAGNDEMIVAEVEDESGELLGQAQEPAPSRSSRPQRSAAPAYTRTSIGATPSPSVRTRGRRPTQDTGGIKAMAVPVVITVGVLLIIPGIWALMALMGIASTEREGATGMALLMLIAWPISFCLLAAGVVMFMQLQTAKKRK